MTDYIVLDVFTDTPFGGNPLAVIPDATDLPEAELQKIAREFNFSETVFLYPPEEPDDTARLRIFTPTMEIPFAGHPTIGAAIALAQQGHGPAMRLALGVGPLTARATPTEASFDTAVPLDILGQPSPALVARALGLPESAICLDNHAPTLASVGLPFTLTELTSRAALAACSPDTEAFREGAAVYKGALDFAQFAYWQDGETLHARMFAPLDNIPEDPATGSACAALGAFLARLSSAPVAFTVLQGQIWAAPRASGYKPATAVSQSQAKPSKPCKVSSRSPPYHWPKAQSSAKPTSHFDEPRHDRYNHLPLRSQRPAHDRPAPHHRGCAARF